MGNLIDRIFALPDVSRRDNIPHFLYPRRFSKTSDDTYVTYLCFKRGFVVCIILVAMNWISYAYGVRFDFGPFMIDVPKDEFAKAFLFSFPKYTSAILLSLLFPFHLALFRYHINPRTFDLLWWNEYFTIRSRRQRGKVLFHTVFTLFCLPIAMFGSFGLPYFAMKAYDAASSFSFFIGLMLFYSIVLPWANSLAVMTSAVIWRYSIEYEGD
jgi:hypothetical protein